MFGLFKRKTDEEKLMAEYKKLMEQAYKASHVSRKESDSLTARANDLLKKIDDMNGKSGK